MSPFQPMTVAQIIDEFIPGKNPFYWEAFDGSSTGNPDAKYTVRINNVEGLSYIATSPGDVGLARAYVTEGLSFTGEHPAHPYGIFDSLRDFYEAFERPAPKTLLRILRSLGSMGAIQVQPLPEVERASRIERIVRHGLTRHTKERDAEAISSHYDVSNDFYELVLGDSMTYTCACYPRPDATLAEAQENKYRLVFEKLGLQKGDRLLDIGCGWGSMVRYAARQGVHAIGVTLSKEQAEWAQHKIAEEGLSDLAEVRHMDYRDVQEEGFDGISSIGLLEHIGVPNYADYFEFLSGKLRPGGVMVNHCITYPDNHRTRRGTFIDRYIFPDGELIEDQRVVTFDELVSRPVTRVVLRAPGMSVERFSQIVADSGLHSVEYAIGWTAWLDVAPEGVTKASALDALIARLGTDSAHVLAVGDGSNDVEMIEWAGAGVVMGSAPQWVRDRGDILTEPVWRDGCAAVLDALIERVRHT